MIRHLELGKLPPQAVDLEEAVLGAAMLEQRGKNTALEIMRPEVFYKESNSRIFEAIQILHKDGEPVDILTVTQKLRSMGHLEDCGGAAHISKLTSRIASTANVEAHCRIVLQKYILREIIRLAQDTTAQAYEETTDLFELLDMHNKRIGEILNSNIKPDAVSMQTVMQEVCEDVAIRNQTHDYISGIPSGIHSLDRVCGGYTDTDLIYIAGRPGMGKTAFMISTLLNQARKGYPVAVFSLEMSREQLVYRMASQLTGIDNYTISRKQLDGDRMKEFNKAVSILEKLPIYIDHTAAISIYDLRAKARRLQQQHGVKIIYIDYIQLMTTGVDGRKQHGNREQEVSEISRTLKQVAKENDVPVICLSQLNRGVESRPDKRPNLSDLRDSGSLEQDADMVLFLYRPDYYGRTEFEDGTPTAGLGEAIIAKNRHGSCTDVRMKFVDYLTLYCDVNEKLSFATGEHKAIQPNTNFPVSSQESKENETPF
jgi:replicative DNA helicase